MINHLNGNPTPTHDPNSPGSTPDYDEWGPDDKWDCNDWRTWHGALKKKYGHNKANLIWAKAWQSQGIFSEAINCRSFDFGFREWAKGQGLYDALYWGAAGVVVKPIGAAGDVIDAIPKIASGAASAATWLWPLAAVAAIGYLYIMYVPKPKR